MNPTKHVYLFSEGNKDMRDLLGGKGANLAEMTNAGLPVPPGFIITTEACNDYSASGRIPAGLMDDVHAALRQVEKATSKRFGDPKNPLLVSVRSGAKFSMPGMMDTVLNLGLNDQTVEGLGMLMGSERPAYDCYRRLLMMFGDVVLGIPRKLFEHDFYRVKQALRVDRDTDVSADGLKRVVLGHKAIIKKHWGPFPQDPYQQLTLALEAVFKSWNNPRAITYRNLNKIPHDLGTAVNVQAMVFGNMGGDSATGVVLTRDPITGEKVLFGDFLMNAQGEDVVAGIRTTQPISDLAKTMPPVHRQLLDTCQMLERHYRDMQDCEFTIERGRLYMLQTRAGKRFVAAAVKIAVDMVNEGLLTKEEAVLRVDPAELEHLFKPQVDPRARVEVLTTGLAAGPGAAIGHVVFDADTAERRGKNGERVIMVRHETNPNDIHGIAAAQGILTASGGMASHAALVSRQMGIPAVVGASAIVIEESARLFHVDGRTVRENDLITVDGSGGRVIWGAAPVVEPQVGGELSQLLAWADKIRRLGVRANADMPKDAKAAFDLGAEGIGLCRTEHMFLAPERLPLVQQMILAETPEEREPLLKELARMQQKDFEGILKAMQGRPVTIRLLDPPLHEFLPRREELIEEVAVLRATKPTSRVLKRKTALLDRVNQMHEANPMLGLRGCRLGITLPDINEMQVRAIFKAAVKLHKQGLPVHPEIMIPLVGHANELKVVRNQLEQVAKQVMKKAGVQVHYAFGTMVELPRACLTADKIAEYAQFFSFGTNDLTQTVFGYSRDDAEAKFVQLYLEKKILPENPFVTIDRDGVGDLMRVAVERGRRARPDLKLGICGEHGGDPDSIHFCHELGLNYVSCSPLRVPTARLAAARAALAGREVVTDK